MSSAEQVTLLKQFVQMCKQDHSLLHKEEFAFYRDYLESLGAKIPTDTSTSDQHESEENEPKSGQQEAKEEEKKEEQMEEELPMPDLDNSGVVTDQTDDLLLSMGDPDKEVDDGDVDRANENREAAMTAFNEGDYQKALDLLTQAIMLNPGSAILHAKRANTLLKMYKMKAAIQDCDKAITINPDSAQPYKFRGRANQLLGNWVEAHQDLAMSCKLDYDDMAYGWMKEVESNAKKLQEHERANQRRAEEKVQRERLERVRRAQEANKRAKERATENAEGPEEEGHFGGMGMFTELFKELSDDPELLNAIKNDPSLIQNPANMMKYMNDPNIQKILGKLGNKFGASGAPPEFADETGHEAHSFGATTEGQDQGTTGNDSAPPKKAPEPDLD
uniref:TPR_REGION domain-containing protein n=1 Tax=Globodera pallida TaxID=36090 RepID=A0A183C4V7_GLOPA